MSSIEKATTNDRAITTPFIDALCGGGLSVLAIGGFLIAAIFLPVEMSRTIAMREIVIVAALINWPHFMASYRLLYCSVENVGRYKWASFYVPSILVVCGGYAFLTAGEDTSVDSVVNPGIVEALSTISSFYLAWHYTGQAWGTTASFAYIAGIRIDKWERLFIRSGLRVLLVWHVLWAVDVSGMGEFAERWLNGLLLFWKADWSGSAELSAPLIRFATLRMMCHWAAIVSFPLGVFGFLRIRNRTGQAVPLRAILPWVSIYLWYLLIYYYAMAIFWLQISHALQYSIFPLRVELNRYSQRTPGDVARQVRHVVLYYGILVGVGALAFKAPELLFPQSDPQHFLAALISAVLNIHHYFIDGCVWKISNPEVRRDLFAHLKTD